LFHQIGGFNHRQLAQFFHDICNVSHITFYFRLVVCFGRFRVTRRSFF
jgi:hypothetical protein